MVGMSDMCCKFCDSLIHACRRFHRGKMDNMMVTTTEQCIFGNFQRYINSRWLTDRPNHNRSHLFAVIALPMLLMAASPPSLVGGSSAALPHSLALVPGSPRHRRRGGSSYPKLHKVKYNLLLHHYDAYINAPIKVSIRTVKSP